MKSVEQRGVDRRRVTHAPVTEHREPRRSDHAEGCERGKMASDELRVLSQLGGGKREDQSRSERPAPENQRERGHVEVHRARRHPVAAPGCGGDQQQQGGQHPSLQEGVGHRGSSKKRIIRDSAPECHSVG